MAKNTSTAENQGDQAGGVDPNLGSQAQPRQTTPHVDALKATLSVAVKLDMKDLNSVPNAQKLVADIEEFARKAGAHVVAEVSLGRVKETLFK